MPNGRVIVYRTSTPYNRSSNPGVGKTTMQLQALGMVPKKTDIMTFPVDYLKKLPGYQKNPLRLAPKD
ncbi:hypothetical protein TNCV_2404131 [Trichonephila clavipes]|nr:hypothetical protein TNCV_2404131 [Trichonephila clavipes]